MPRLADERKAADADGLHDKPGGKHGARAEAVYERAGEDPCGELRRRRHRDDEAGEPEPEAADVV